MMTAITKTSVKAYLSQQPPEQLIADLLELFTKFPVVRGYYQAKLHPRNEERLLEKYKAAIRQEFFPERGTAQARRSVAKQAIAEYKSVSGDPAGMADLMLFFVEMGVEFTNAYGDMDEPFYNSMASMFYKALQHLVTCGLRERFNERCRAIAHGAAGCGWGFHDTLTELYYRYYQEPL